MAIKIRSSYIWQSDEITTCTSDANPNSPHINNKMLTMSYVDNEHNAYIKICLKRSESTCFKSVPAHCISFTGNVSRVCCYYYRFGYIDSCTCQYWHAARVNIDTCSYQCSRNEVQIKWSDIAISYSQFLNYAGTYLWLALVFIARDFVKCIFKCIFQVLSVCIGKATVSIQPLFT